MHASDVDAQRHLRLATSVILRSVGIIHYMSGPIGLEHRVLGALWMSASCEGAFLAKKRLRLKTSFA